MFDEKKKLPAGEPKPVGDVVKMTMPARMVQAWQSLGRVARELQEAGVSLGSVDNALAAMACMTCAGTGLVEGSILSLPRGVKPSKNNRTQRKCRKCDGLGWSAPKDDDDEAPALKES